jgi:hypothetical protein
MAMGRMGVVDPSSLHCLFTSVVPHIARHYVVAPCIWCSPQQQKRSPFYLISSDVRVRVDEGVIAFTLILIHLYPLLTI